MIVDESAALFLLPLQQPVADFKDQIGKLRVARDTPPRAEGLHQPRHLPEIAQITKTMPVIMECPVQFRRVRDGEPGFSGHRQRQQYLAGEIVLKAVVNLGPSAMGENKTVLTDRGPKGLRQSGHLRAAIIASRKLTERKDKKRNFRDRGKLLSHFQPDTLIAEPHGLQQERERPFRRRLKRRTLQCPSGASQHPCGMREAGKVAPLPQAGSERLLAFQERSTPHLVTAQIIRNKTPPPHPKNHSPPTFHKAN